MIKSANSIFFKWMLSLFFLTILLSSCRTSKTNKIMNSPVEYSMMVTRILPDDGGDFIKIAFNRSQRIYKIDKKSDPEYLNLIKQSLQDNMQVIIKRENERSDVIIGVKKIKGK